MKNRLTKFITTTICSVAVLTGFSSCMDPIFQNIDEEVRLEKMTIHGDVYSFARTGGNPETDPDAEIFLANGKIYHKKASHDNYKGWKEFPKPEGHVLTIASDGNDNLYAVTVFVYEDESAGEMKVSEKRVYSCNITDKVWKPVKFGDKQLSASKNTVCALMGTNSLIPANRKAYININKKGYELSNGSATECTAANDKFACASLNGTTKFYSQSSRGAAACSSYDDKTVYYAVGSTLKAVGLNDSFEASGIRGAIYGIAVMKDSILINTSSGAALIDINSGDEIKQFSNLNSTLSTLYEGRACIAAYPEKDHTDTPIYAGITVEGSGSNSALFSHEGLWAFYPQRGTWNVE